jgi:hypothetical protein
MSQDEFKELSFEVMGHVFQSSGGSSTNRSTSGSSPAESRASSSNSRSPFRVNSEIETYEAAAFEMILIGAAYLVRDARN